MLARFWRVLGEQVAEFALTAADGVGGCVLGLVVPVDEGEGSK